jgi:hypothetical protein
VSGQLVRFATFRRTRRNSPSDREVNCRSLFSKAPFHCRLVTPISLFLFVEGLSPRYLSPYGCTWADHPALNALAADSVVFENAVADTIDPLNALKAILASLPSTNNVSGQEAPGFPCIPGDNLILVTDSPAMTTLPEITFRFGEVITLPEPGPDNTNGELAADVSETHLAHCFARLISLLEQITLPATVVVYLSSMTRVWDAPLELREKYREEGDPEPVADCRPPQNLQAREEARVEELVGITQAIAAQIEVLDICLGTLFHELRAAGLYDDSQVVLAAPFAISAGHHGVTGISPGHLASDVLDIPLFIKFRGSAGTMAWRDHGLIQPSMIFPLLVSTIGDNSVDTRKVFCRNAPAAVRITSGDQVAVRTDAWLLASIECAPRLFAKPDDRWDVNPVEDRCRDVADGLLSLRDDLDSAE